MSATAKKTLAIDKSSKVLAKALMRYPRAPIAKARRRVFSRPRRSERYPPGILKISAVSDVISSINPRPLYEVNLRVYIAQMPIENQLP